MWAGQIIRDGYLSWVKLGRAINVDIHGKKRDHHASSLLNSTFSFDRARTRILGLSSLFRGRTMTTFQRKRSLLLLADIFLVGISLFGARLFTAPRVLKASEIPIAFWAWRNEMPDNSDLQPVVSETGAKILFLRSGQFDETDGKISRIRPASGRFPSGIELHLVYNGTRKFLQTFEKTDSETAAAAFLDTYSKDVAKAKSDGVDVHGIQLDLDVPERLLPRYAEILAKLRQQLPAESKLSITGLPSWLVTVHIKSVLSHVDFWVPQCYGAAIPTNINQHIPISTAVEVARSVAKARELSKPFWAGLSAYSYAILYDQKGDLVELRGDIDPAVASKERDLELIESANFQENKISGERRFVYRARTELVLDGLIMKAGEKLVFDVPSAESLRATARAVRENAGESLLGICVFRLPSHEDPATLTINEIAAALSDRQTKVSTAIELKKLYDKKIELRATNEGDGAASFGDGALTIDIHVPTGGVAGVPQILGFTGYETLCEIDGLENARPCSSLRSNVVRLKGNSWRPGDSAVVTFILKNDLPDRLHADIRTRISDTYVFRESLDIQLSQSEK